MWSRAGIGKERIAQRLGTTVRNVENCYPYELGYTDEESLAMVADVAFQMAVSGEHPTMTKFWLEVKGGWVPGMSAPGLGGKKPLQIIIDPSVAVEGEYEEVGEMPEDLDSELEDSSSID
jgi:hypothetical protein